MISFLEATWWCHDRLIRLCTRIISFASERTASGDFSWHVASGGSARVEPRPHTTVLSRLLEGTLRNSAEWQMCTGCILAASMFLARSLIDAQHLSNQHATLVVQKRCLWGLHVSARIARSVSVDGGTV